MATERQTGLILSHVETWVAELERAVQSFEGRVARAEQRANELADWESAHNTNIDSGLHILLTDALQTSHVAEEQVSAANTALSDALAQAELTLCSSDPVDELAPLQAGTLVCAGRYRVLQLLHSRPRVHLYLARRLSDDLLVESGPLVAIRELVLNGLDAELRQCIEHAAFEEFAAPQLFGTPHLPGIGDRGYLENERQYLVMQTRQVRGSIPAFAVLLSELLPSKTRGSAGPDISTALSWGIQICHTVAHLHSMQNILGELTPDMLLVDREGSASWAPILLASWPPAPRFWPGPSQGEEYHQVFPTKHEGTRVTSDKQGFAAPEIHEGLRDERSDIYALGAILYLLLTGSVPPAAMQRLQAEGMPKAARGERAMLLRNLLNWQRSSHASEQGKALTPPHLLNKRISPLLERILLRALALNPERRFANARDLAEALEGLHLKADTNALPQAKASRLRRLLEWIRK